MSNLARQLVRERARTQCRSAEPRAQSFPLGHSFPDISTQTVVSLGHGDGEFLFSSLGFIYFLDILQKACSL